MGWFEWSAWWFGTIGVAAGAVGVLWGIWARNHPKHSLLVSDVVTSRISVPQDEKVTVSYDQRPLTNPTLVRLSVTHRGGPEIDKFDRGAVTFTRTTGGVVTLLGEGRLNASIEVKTGNVIVEPRIFKTGESLVLDLLCDGDPGFQSDVRIANVTHQKHGMPTKMSILPTAIAAAVFILTPVTIFVLTRTGALTAAQGWSLMEKLGAVLVPLGTVWIVMFSVLRMRRAAHGEL